MDRFTYRVYDRSRLHSEAIVTVNINRTVPVAMEDYTKIFYNYEGILRPLKNDSVLHSQLLPESLEIVYYPSYDHLSYLGGGMLRYGSNANYTDPSAINQRVIDKNA